jgi:hypothetical protein
MEPSSDPGFGCYLDSEILPKLGLPPAASAVAHEEMRHDGVRYLRRTLVICGRMRHPDGAEDLVE